MIVRQRPSPRYTLGGRPRSQAPPDVTWPSRRLSRPQPVSVALDTAVPPPPRRPTRRNPGLEKSPLRGVMIGPAGWIATSEAQVASLPSAWGFPAAPAGTSPSTCRDCAATLALGSQWPGGAFSDPSPIRQSRPMLRGIAQNPAEVTGLGPAEASRDRDVFISHTTGDNETAVRAVAHALRARASKPGTTTPTRAPATALGARSTPASPPAA